MNNTTSHQTMPPFHRKAVIVSIVLIILSPFLCCSGVYLWDITLSAPAYMSRLTGTDIRRIPTQSAFRTALLNRFPLGTNEMDVYQILSQYGIHEAQAEPDIGRGYLHKNEQNEVRAWVKDGSSIKDILCSPYSYTMNFTFDDQNRLIDVRGYSNRACL